MSEFPPAPEPTPYSAAPGGQPGAAPAKKAPVLSIVSLITGILGVLGSAIGFLSLFGLVGVILPIAAIITGFLGKSKEAHAKGMWLTGLITGFVGLALTLLFVLLSTLFFASLAEYGNSYEFDNQF